jgi:hypothetical protein
MLDDHILWWYNVPKNERSSDAFPPWCKSYEKRRIEKELTQEEAFLYELREYAQTN